MCRHKMLRGKLQYNLSSCFSRLQFRRSRKIVPILHQERYARSLICSATISVVELAPQVYVALWASPTCVSVRVKLRSLTALLKGLLRSAFCKSMVSISRPLKSQNVRTASVFVKFTLHHRVIVFPSCTVMRCCVVVTFCTSKRKTKSKVMYDIPQSLSGDLRGLLLV